MSLWWSIINRPTAGETRRAVLAQLRRANNLKEREIEALERLAKQQEDTMTDKWQPDKSFVPRPLVIAGLIEDAAKKPPADARADFAEILASEDDRATILRALRESAE